MIELMAWKIGHGGKKTTTSTGYVSFSPPCFSDGFCHFKDAYPHEHTRIKYTNNDDPLCDHVRRVDADITRSTWSLSTTYAARAKHVTDTVRPVRCTLSAFESY